MKSRRIISLIFAVLMAVTAAIPAFADTYEIDLKINEVNHIKLQNGDILKGKIKSNRALTFVTTGNAKPKISISYQSGLSTATQDLKTTESGNILDIVDFGKLFGLISTESTVTVSAADGKKCEFDFYIVECDISKSGITKQPDNIGTVFYEDKDFTANGAIPVFATRPDLTGAVFSFKDSGGNEILAINGNDIYSILNTPVYSGLAITYSVDLRIGNLINGTITYKAVPNPIKYVRIVEKPAEAPTYRFGRDGKIKGTLGNYAFIPDIKFDGITLEVTYKDYVERLPEEIKVQHDSAGYYIEIPDFGRQDIIYEANVKENKTAVFQSTVYVGSYKFLMDINIEKASFFEMIPIWFGLLFGRYR
ncbi:MAG: hypothetical protein K6F64_01790 [Clostridia bacterium]|nr:hypothetical protein [Clostridia bacterium]